MTNMYSGRDSKDRSVLLQNKKHGVFVARNAELLKARSLRLIHSRLFLAPNSLLLLS